MERGAWHYHTSCDRDSRSELLSLHTNELPLFLRTARLNVLEEYLSKAWKEPEELYWVGKYAADAHKIFVERKWRQVQPSDHALKWWVEWMRGTPQAGEVRLEGVL